MFLTHQFLSVPAWRLQTCKQFNSFDRLVEETAERISGSRSFLKLSASLPPVPLKGIWFIRGLSESQSLLTDHKLDITNSCSPLAVSLRGAGLKMTRRQNQLSQRLRWVVVFRRQLQRISGLVMYPSFSKIIRTTVENCQLQVGEPLYGRRGSLRSGFWDSLQGV